MGNPIAQVVRLYLTKVSRFFFLSYERDGIVFQLEMMLAMLLNVS